MLSPVSLILLVVLLLAIVGVAIKRIDWYVGGLIAAITVALIVGTFLK